LKRALITGITGQDGSYLTEFLIKKGYTVHGIIRRASSFNTQRIDHLFHHPQLKLHHGDLHDSSSLSNILEMAQPDEIYNLGAQSHVKVSFEQPEYTADVVGMGVLRLLIALQRYIESSGKNPRFYQAGSSEMYGASPPPQNENTLFYPRSPYAVSKVTAYYHTINYREAYGMFAVNGILFNHESPRRGETFVTRKITRALGRIKMGLQEKLYLGNLDAKRDWGFAGDYIEAMWMMLQQPEPDNYIIATDESHSVSEFLDESFSILDMDWREYVEIDPRYLRLTEVDYLLGDSTETRKKLDWKPKVSFKGLVKMMVEHDLELANRERIMRDKGLNTATY
jgi:GDPmannose 4,6-dehydratase